MAGKFILKVDDIKRGESRGVNLVAGTGIALNVTEVEGDHVIAEVEIENTGGAGSGDTLTLSFGGNTVG